MLGKLGSLKGKEDGGGFSLILTSISEFGLTLTILFLSIKYK